jgi:Acyl-CoA dehydrogenase, C-terminal domain
MSCAVSLAPSADEADIAASIRRILEREWSTARARAHGDDPGPGQQLWHRTRDWGALVDAGLPSTCLAHEQVGGALAPAHLWGAHLATVLLRRADHPLADAIAAGQRRATCAAATSPAAPLPYASWIAEPHDADVVVALDDAAIVLHDAPRCTPQPTIDGSRRYGSLAGASPTERVPMPPGSLDAFRQAGALIAAADALGACRRLVETTRRYVREREQFGRPIATFQSVAHRIVDMDVAVQIARAALLRAAVLVDAGAPGRDEAVMVAKGSVGEVVRQVTRGAVQLHGAIGYTWDHDVHLWIRRAYVSDRLFGSGTAHDRALARRLARAVRPSSREGEHDADER